MTIRENYEKWLKDFATDEETIRELEAIRKACRESGKLCMIYTTTIEEARMRLAEGFEAISHSLDAALYAQVYRETMAAIRPSASISSEKE